VAAVLVARIEVWPYGDATQGRLVGLLTFANSTGEARSSYACLRLDDTGREEALQIDGHHRADGFWPLIARGATSSGGPLVPGSPQVRMMARCYQQGLDLPPIPKGVV
jgi:hypothetical protein